MSRSVVVAPHPDDEVLGCSSVPSAEAVASAFQRVLASGT
jgi:LmbE family N-acetylglucosaminyl deacetylase